METTRDPKKICSLIGFALLGMMLVWIASTYAISYFLAQQMPWFFSYGWAGLFINDATLYLLGVPVFLLVLHFIPNGPKPTQPRPRTTFGPGKFVLTMIFNYGASWALSFVSVLLILIVQLAMRGLSPGSPPSAADLASPSWVANLFFMVLVPAVGEEFLFRYMLRRKLEGSGDKIYIFFSALCFSLFHANLAQSLFTFVVGAVFAWVYTISGKLWVPMLMHFLLNLMGAVIVPSLINYDWVLIIYLMIVMVIFIITAIVFFFVFKGFVFSTMQPPHEAGWPYKQIGRAHV